MNQGIPVIEYQWLGGIFDTLASREVSLVPSGQNPISLEYQIHPPTIDTPVTGMVSTTMRATPYEQALKMRYAMEKGPDGWWFLL